MYYQEALQVAKEYRRTFGYEFNRTARKDPTLHLSLALLLMMIACFVSMILNVGLFSQSSFFVLMLMFEIAFILCFFVHSERQKNKKMEDYRTSVNADKKLTNVQLKEHWINNHVKVEQEDYLDLAENIEKIQSTLKAHQTKTLSYFDHYIRIISSWSKPLKILLVSIAIPIIVFVFQAILKEEKWTTSIISNITSQSLQSVIIWTLGIVVAGAVISFLMSMTSLYFEYRQDFINERGCSESSIETLKYDLVRFSKIKLGKHSDSSSD